MGDVVYPSSIDDFTPQYVQTLLRAAGHEVEVSAVHPQLVGEGVGLVGTLLALHLEGSESLPRSMVAKFPSPFEVTRDLAQFYGFYRSEVECYRAARTHGFGVRLPHCYVAEVSDDDRDTILMIEDLSHLRQASQVDGASVSDAERIVDAAAALHARWWESPELDELAWLRPLNNPAYKAGQDHYAQALPVFEEMFGDAAPAGSIDIVRRHGPTIRSHYDWLWANRPHSLAHVDFRLDNFFFDDHAAEPGHDVVIIDWQLAVRSIPMGDVSYFLVQSLTVDDRRRHGESLLRRYHEALMAAGVQDYSWDAAVTDFRRAVLTQLTIPVVGAANLDPANERGKQLMDALALRNLQALLDYDCAELVHDA
jgi:hypothetical protein